MSDPRQGAPKIFSIGLFKTGTSTLRGALQTLGIGVRNVDKSLRPAIRAGRLDGFWRFVEENGEEELLRGWPLPLLYRDILARYGPRARFIMTTRRDPETWVRSLKRHVMRRGPLNNLRNIEAFGRLYPHGQERHHAACYSDHIRAVHAHFLAAGAQGQLLEISWERGEGWPELCAFLGRPVPATPIPHQNRSAELEGRRVNQVVNGILAAGYRRLRHE